MFDRDKTIAFLVPFALILCWSTAAFAQGAADNASTVSAYLALGSGLGIGIAALGTGIGIGLAASSALEGIGRNPGSSDEMFVPFILALAFVEAIAIYAFVVSIILQGKIAV